MGDNLQTPTVTNFFFVLLEFVLLEDGHKVDTGRPWSKIMAQDFSARSNLIVSRDETEGTLRLEMKER
jgi:hypothetical protein